MPEHNLNLIKNIGLIGLGPHAQRIYYPFIEKYFQRYQLKLTLLVELKSHQAWTQDWLLSRAIQPAETFFIESALSDLETLDGATDAFLARIHQIYRLDGLIIASSPKSHKAYLKWALLHDIDVLIDKPITAPDQAGQSFEQAQLIAQDFEELAKLYQRSRSNVVVQAQRRAHAGYCQIRRYLQAFMQEFQVPISYLDISHTDGMWVMPNEWERENHPYKYGTGKLMHSGYHFVDLLAWLLQLNVNWVGHKPTVLEMFVQSFKPLDFMQQLRPEHYQHFFQKDFSEYFSESRLETLKNYGELDIFMLAQLKQGDSVVTTTSLNLQQNSFSQRSWSTLPSDVYKGNGRIRHERLNLQVSTLLNIQVHSYQSHQIKEISSIEYGAGHLDHFDILIFRNSQLVGGKPFEKIEIGREALLKQDDLDSSFGHNEQAREVLFLDFLHSTVSASDLLTHHLTVQLMSTLYRCLVMAKQGQIPFYQLPLDALWGS